MPTNTKQTAISAGSVTPQTIPVNYNRRQLWIQSYGAPEQSSNPTMWVAFGVPATAGTNGEIQIVGGAMFVWGAGDSYQRGASTEFSVCPGEYISIIAQSGTAVGMVQEYSGQI